MHREKAREMVAKHGFTNPRVYGSMTVDEDRVDSDLDVLVGIFPGTTLFDLGSLQFELQELVGINQNSITPVTSLNVVCAIKVLAPAKPV